MNRIGKAFADRFREMLGGFGARQRDKGVRLLFQKAHSNGTQISHELAEQNCKLAEKLHRFNERRGITSGTFAGKVICDAGLGGLARWLRASGCDAAWIQGITDENLIQQPQDQNATIITTDSLLLERRVITSGAVKALWVPPTLKISGQLRLVRAELNLHQLESRCMRCGGELREVNKEAIKEKIPPKTYSWIDEYFQCQRCGKIFWKGTHWKRIESELQKASGFPSK
jgi:uncharacterized protein with PIN domain